MAAATWLRGDYDAGAPRRWQKGRRTARKRPAVGSRLDLMASREASCLIGGVVLRRRCDDYRPRMFTVANGHGDAL